MLIMRNLNLIKLHFRTYLRPKARVQAREMPDPPQAREKPDPPPSQRKGPGNEVGDVCRTFWEFKKRFWFQSPRVFSLKRFTAEAFTVLLRVLNRKQKCQAEIMFCFRISTS